MKAFFDSGEPVAAICRGPWMLVEADAARGRRFASWALIKTDIRNAGAEWIESGSCSEDKLATSRKPDDIPAFNRAMIESFGQTEKED